MKLYMEEYSAYSKDGEYSLDVKVNKELRFSHIMCGFSTSWRSKDDTIEYLQWCIEQIKVLPDE